MSSFELTLLNNSDEHVAYHVIGEIIDVDHHYMACLRSSCFRPEISMYMDLTLCATLDY